MHVLVTGSSGLVGTVLTDFLLRSDDRVTILVRGESKHDRRINALRWDPTADSLDLAPAGNIDAVVHLAGASIGGKRWSPEYKALIRDSRVRGTRLISKAIAALDHKPSVMVMASAMGYYGDRGDEELTEESGPGEGFLAEVAVEWERSADPAREAGVRVVATRFGNILGRDGGMLPRLKLPFLTGLGGRIGSGKQWWPWIAVEDVARVIQLAIKNPNIDGPVNTVSPGITRQIDFARALAKALHRPAITPLPAWAAKLIVGGLAEEGLLASQKMLPAVLLNHGFEFLGEDLPTVFHHVFRAPSENEWR
jgi:hypothetical protein